MPPRGENVLSSRREVDRLRTEMHSPVDGVGKVEFVEGEGVLRIAGEAGRACLFERPFRRLSATSSMRSRNSKTCLRFVPEIGVAGWRHILAMMICQRGKIEKRGGEAILMIPAGQVAESGSSKN